MNKESMEKALERFMPISPLLEEDLETAERRKRRCKYFQRPNLRSPAPLLTGLQAKGLNGLMPKSAPIRDKQEPWKIS